ncbi:693_t:CDS:2 [Dentiscutata erythropus]|uniref:693_t:CDS:1 n=1 Tax=Dentiscutata erythropus TaxID=1348616 RepID=A0A9N9EHN1_9GLOM|nr:693_t:CDS:2 [Dentiscutata erythropus]
MSLKTFSDSDFDVKIIVGNGQNIKEFKAHSTILSSRSLYFQRALSGRWSNKEHDFYVIKNPNIYPYTFKIILDYIYKEKTILRASAETCLNLMAASDELELLNLAECAQKHLIKKHSSWLLNEAPYFSKTSNSFIFSFTDPSNPILSRVIMNNKAIWSDKYHGPCFGNSDLCMRLDHWESVCTNYYCNIVDLSQFAVEEYEVFAVYNFNSSKTAILKRIQQFKNATKWVAQILEILGILVPGEFLISEE